jgi:pimeloyl-ACP methyl ester carboxylesterase
MERLVETSDGLVLAVEEWGAGVPVVFLHEFAGNRGDWTEQRAAFADGFRCIAFNARGYPPSSVPEDAERYSQEAFVADLATVIDDIDAPCHLVGLSMGALTALLFALREPHRARSLVLAGIGTGMLPESRPATAARLAELVALLRSPAPLSVEHLASGFAGPHLRHRMPRHWERMLAMLGGLRRETAATILERVQLRRPTLDELLPGLARLELPTLLVVGDDDANCLGASLRLRDAIPAAALAVLPSTGHLVQLERAASFNALVRDFLEQSDRVP